ncbi:hypothetical protein MJT46_016293 [Ovis ammon polii x Ovis aries]|nr:hypothetical protein MJT46_016293 [Ovis ammon polii x Ovis aries]
MDSEISEAFQKELTCFVCLNFLLDPVTIGCGHSFCRSCICLFWEQAFVFASCPVCRQRSEQTNFKTNFLLKTLVSTVRKANLRQFLKCEEHLCGAHKQTKTIFCEADKSLLCLVCSQGQEHKTHRHCPAEEAAEESWEKLANQIRSLWEKIQETERNRKKHGRGTDPWMFYVYRHGDMIRRTYQMAPPLLPEEDYYVESVIKEGENIYDQLISRQEEIIGKKRELLEIHKELIQMCFKLDVELLQELEDKLKWSESAQLHVPQPLLPELPARPMSGLMDWLNLFRVNFSFSNEVSSQHIRLFDDARRLTYEHDNPHAPSDGGTAKHFASWGDQSFTSGKQYWEMLVDSSWDWARRGGGGGPELVTVILLHTHKEKVVPVGLVQYAGVLPYPGILTDAYSPVPRAVHAHLPVLFAGDGALGSPSSKILPCSTTRRRMGTVVFILQTSCVIEQPDALTAYFITERKSDCGEMREYASQN